MKVRLNSEGIVEAERAGAWKKQLCTRVPGQHCGDSCPLLMEDEVVRPSFEVEMGMLNLTLYCAHFVYTECQDLRPKVNP